MKFTLGRFELTSWGCIAKVIVTTLLYNDLPVQLADLEALVRPESYRFVSLWIDTRGTQDTAINILFLPGSVKTPSLSSAAYTSSTKPTTR